jgi:lipoate-protein ligase A
MTWQFLNTGFRPGRENMAIDEELALALVQGGTTATVRVYGWSPPAISLGWNQSIDEIDLGRARDAGIDVIRRPTGGRAILHSEELTYSVTMLSERSSVLEVYNRISVALVKGLELLGASARLEKSQPHFPTLYRDVSSAACFASSARHEIKIGSQKLVGSAQRRYSCPDGGEVVLQHGSVLLGKDHRRLVDFLRLPHERLSRLVRSELEQHTTDLSSALGRTVHFQEVAASLRLGFERAWKIDFTTCVRAPESWTAMGTETTSPDSDHRYGRFQSI